jgi:hypothetical protein
LLVTPLASGPCTFLAADALFQLTITILAPRVLKLITASVVMGSWNTPMPTVVTPAYAVSQGVKLGGAAADHTFTTLLKITPIHSVGAIGTFERSAVKDLF